MKKVILIIAICMLAACANKNMWVKQGGGDFNIDNAQCNAMAASIQGASYVQVSIAHDQCLIGKGWSIQDRKSYEMLQRSAQSLMAENKLESEARCSNSTYRLYYAKTACFADDISFEQIADASKATSQQKTAIVAVRKSIDDQNVKFLASARKINQIEGENIAKQYRKKGALNDKNNLDLLSGKITWGEYNQKRKEIALLDQ